MHQSDIKISVFLDEEKMPETIRWQAEDGGVEEQEAKAILLSLWNGPDKTALRIDLWTRKMMVDEMNDFLYQTFFGLADTYTRATRNTALATEIRAFAKEFHRKASAALEAEQG